MRHVSASIVILTSLSIDASAQPLEINQSAWLNYAIVVNTTQKDSSLRLNQRGEINGISSAQLSGMGDAEIGTHQRGRRNSAVLYQQGWVTASRVIQEGPHGSGGYTNLPNNYSIRLTDEGYLSYFMTGGFSFVTLTDQNHTWISRFGRAR
jgi:hypothetical protein